MTDSDEIKIRLIPQSMPSNVTAVVAPEAANMLSNFWEKSKNADIENAVQIWLNELKKSTQAISTEDTLGVLNEDTKQHLGNMVDVLQRLVKEKSSSTAVDNFLQNNNAELSDAIKALSAWRRQCVGCINHLHKKKIRMIGANLVPRPIR